MKQTPLTALLTCFVLAVMSVGATPVLAQGRDPESGVRDLWNQYPLEQGSASPRTDADGRSTPPARPIAAPSTSIEDGTIGPGRPLLVALAALGLWMLGVGLGMPGVGGALHRRATRSANR